MTTTILKHDGIYVYDDYYRPKAILRIRELSPENPVQNIYRSRTHTDVEAVLVSKDWYDVKSPNSPLPIVVEEVADDYMGVNLSNMINLILGRPETKDLTRKVVNEGTTQLHYKTYAIIQTKKFYHDGNDVVPYEETNAVKVGGNVLAYLIHPDLYAAIA